ncbi:MAG TPA: methyltransferase domain-containing protein [Clostridia bacterium]|nr:methyltransferase domain-containing protein [Clostridia bacterium]
MTDQAARYDRIAEGYARWWAPVLAPFARAVLDLLSGDVDGRAARLLDVGSGTGTLSVAALERWPGVRVDAIDASGEMIAATRATVGRIPERAERFDGATAFADRLPFADGTFDAAMSSFVLQLVPNRHRALREIRRVLRPGGRLAYVTWVVDGRSWRPDEIVDDVLEDLGIEPREDAGIAAPSAGDLPSAESAANGLRRAGFHSVTWRVDRLRYQFDPESYTGFITEFDEQDLVEGLDPDVRARLVRELRQRLGRLRSRDLVLETPIAYTTGLKPGG